MGAVKRIIIAELLTRLHDKYIDVIIPTAEQKVPGIMYAQKLRVDTRRLRSIYRAPAV